MSIWHENLNEEFWKYGILNFGEFDDNWTPWARVQQRRVKHKDPKYLTLKKADSERKQVSCG